MSAQQRREVYVVGFGLRVVVKKSEQENRLQEQL